MSDVFICVYLIGVGLSFYLNGAILKRHDGEPKPGHFVTPLLSWFWILMCLGIILTPKAKK